MHTQSPSSLIRPSGRSKPLLEASLASAASIDIAHSKVRTVWAWDDALKRVRELPFFIQTNIARHFIAPWVERLSKRSHNINVRLNVNSSANVLFSTRWSGYLYAHPACLLSQHVQPGHGHKTKNLPPFRFIARALKQPSRRCRKLSKATK